jgi:hypothetical protein
LNYTGVLAFNNVNVDEVAEGELHRAYNSSACPFLSETMAGKLDGKHALLIAVIWAKQDLLLSFSQARAGSVQATLLGYSEICSA